MIYYLFILVISIIPINCDGCEQGWFRYEDSKCVFLFNFDSTYAESENYCKRTFGAQLLNITQDSERVFWSFYLLRYANLTNNVWLQKSPSLENTDNCLVLRSKYSNDVHKVGKIIHQHCDEPGTTVCEISIKQKLMTKEKAVEYDPNELMVPNKRIMFANGTWSNLFTGFFYVITSKYNKVKFSNRKLANGKCRLDLNNPGCKTIYYDSEIVDNDDNAFMFSSDNNQQVQIRKFNSDKILVYEPDKFLANYQCGKDSLTANGKVICNLLLEDNNADDKWVLSQFNNSEYFIIKSTTNNYTLGAKLFDIGPNGTVAFGLYDPVDEKSIVDDRFLFKIEPQLYTLNVQLTSVSFDKSLEDIVQNNRQQISIVDVEVIHNDSPSTLIHEVSNTKELMESFSTSFGESQQFIESFSNLAELSQSFSETRKQARSFADSTSQSISSTLSNTVSNTHSTTDSESVSDSHSEDTGVSVGVSIPIPGTPVSLALGVNAHGGHGTTSTHSSSNTNTNRNDQTTSDENNDKNSHSKTDGDENSHTDGHGNKTSDGKTKENTKTITNQIEQSGTSRRTYTLHKTVSLPPYTAVKISSYANWINDLQIPFNMTLKFSVHSFRRQLSGNGLNFWRTMDSEFVKQVMKQQFFSGDMKEESFDSVVGEINGDLKATVGLDSVFVAKELKLD